MTCFSFWFILFSQVPRQSSNPNILTATGSSRTKSMETLQSDTSGECKNLTKLSPSVLMHSDNDSLPCPAPNFLNSTRLHNGLKHHQILPHSPFFITLPPHPLLVLLDPRLRPSYRSVTAKDHRNPHRNNPPPARRRRAGPLVSVHGGGCDTGSETETGGQRE